MGKKLEKIVDIKYEGEVAFFRLRWKNKDESEDLWLPEEEMVGYRKEINSFLRKLEKRMIQESINADSKVKDIEEPKPLIESQDIKKQEEIVFEATPVSQIFYENELKQYENEDIPEISTEVLPEPEIEIPKQSSIENGFTVSFLRKDTWEKPHPSKVKRPVKSSQMGVLYPGHSGFIIKQIIGLDIIGNEIMVEFEIPDKIGSTMMNINHFRYLCPNELIDYLLNDTILNKN